MAQLPVSLVIITKNEADNIERCIRSVPWAADVVVVDSGSTDRTVEIAKQNGARTFSESWRGYREQKIRATELAKYDWVLSLDADEALSPELAKNLQEKFSQGLSSDGYEFSRMSFYMERWIRHGGWHPDWQLRLFNRKTCQWKKGHVHERVEAPKSERIALDIHHWPFLDLTEQINTNNRYSSLGARDLFDRGQRFSLVKLFVKPISKFLETYFWKRGFLDGLPGFIIAVGAAYSIFLKYAKLYELTKLKKESP